MSGERAPVPGGGDGLLRGNRTRSYGSLTRSPLSPVRQRRIEHTLQPGETLQGLALKYGVSVSMNRYISESIYSFLLIAHLFYVILFLLIRCT